MAKLVLVSILLATFGVPLLTYLDSNPVRGIRKTVILFAIYIVLWAAACVYLYPRMF